MAARIAMCLDELTCKNPEVIGLSGENLELQSWLDVHIGAQEARRDLNASPDVEEVWVAASEDVEAINLAAVLKSDRPDLTVRLVDFDGGGSLLSRAHTAGIDEVMGRVSFVERYANAKRAAAGTAHHVRSGSSAAPDPSVSSLQEGAHGQLAQNAAADLPFKENTSSRAASDAVSRDAARGVTLGPGRGAILAPERETARTPRTLLTLDTSLDSQQLGHMFATAPSSRGQGFLLPVVSGSGGAGKSTVSTIAAFIAQGMGYKTLLLDYDLQFGDVPMLAGVENPLTVEALLAHPESLEGLSSDGRRPALIAAPARLEDAEGVSQAVPSLMSLLLPAFDVVVANTGAAWAEQHAALLERSNAVLFLIDQRASSVRACRHALELCARCGIATGQFQYALNRCAKNAPLTTIDVSCALKGAPVLELKDGGRDVEEYLAAGALLELMDSGNELCESLRALLSDLLPGSAPSAVQQKPPSRGNPFSRRRGRHVGKRKG